MNKNAGDLRNMQIGNYKVNPNDCWPKLLEPTLEMVLCLSNELINSKIKIRQIASKVVDLKKQLAEKEAMIDSLANKLASIFPNLTSKESWIKRAQEEVNEK